MTDALTILADSYLDHIRIAVEAGDRGAPFRDFFDNWNAYRSKHNGHRSRGDRPKWFNNPNALNRRPMLESLDFRSKGAVSIMTYAKDYPLEYKRSYLACDKSTKLVVDHVVPILVMVNMFFESGVDLSRNGVRNHLTKWYGLGLLSDAENRRLDSAGLKSAMPVDWDGEDVFYRYQSVGIEAA